LPFDLALLALARTKRDAAGLKLSRVRLMLGAREDVYFPAPNHALKANVL